MQMHTCLVELCRPACLGQSPQAVEKELLFAGINYTPKKVSRLKALFMFFQLHLFNEMLHPLYLALLWNNFF